MRNTDKNWNGLIDICQPHHGRPSCTHYLRLVLLIGKLVQEPPNLYMQDAIIVYFIACICWPFLISILHMKFPKACVNFLMVIHCLIQASVDMEFLFFAHLWVMMTCIIKHECRNSTEQTQNIKSLIFPLINQAITTNKVPNLWCFVKCLQTVYAV